MTCTVFNACPLCLFVSSDITTPPVVIIDCLSMPQIYRQPSFDSEIPSPTDADDSIVLSDLVRTGEASRLRRRGAMRIDHSGRDARQPLSTSPTQLISSSAQLQSSTVFVPDADNMWASNPEAPADEEYNQNSYPGEWIEMRDGQLEDADYREDLEGESRSYLLCCGGIVEDEWVGNDEPYYISPLPQCSTVRSPYVSRRRPRKSNGCGAVIHINAIPRRRCGVWMAKEGGTDAVVGMDSSYFDRSAVTRMMKSTCGCVREGIGCAVCGNTLGTRYKPCPAAAEGLFSSNRTPSNPVHPSGSKYWHCRQNTARGTKFYVYTFFSDRVSSSPSYLFPTTTASPQLYSLPLSNPEALRSTIEFPTFMSEESENVRPPPRLLSQSPEAEYDMDGDLIIDEPSSPDKTSADDIWPGR